MLYVYFNPRKRSVCSWVTISRSGKGMKEGARDNKVAILHKSGLGFTALSFATHWKAGWFRTPWTDSQWVKSHLGQTRKDLAMPSKLYSKWNFWNCCREAIGFRDYQLLLANKSMFSHDSYFQICSLDPSPCTETTHWPFSETLLKVCH